MLAKIMRFFVNKLEVKKEQNARKTSNAGKIHKSISAKFR